MKNVFVSLLVCISIVSCSGRKDYNDEDYKQMQVEYEKKKAGLNRTKGVLYKENKEKLMALVELVEQLKDSTKSFEGVPTDTNFYKSDVAMASINFDIGQGQIADINTNADKPKAKVFFLHRLTNEALKNIFDDPIKELKACYESNNDIPCMKLNDQELQQILDLQFVFIVDDIIKVDPVVKNSNEFESGLYIGQIICFDILKKSPLLSFVVGAQNSDQISSYNGLVEVEIKRDFNSNIKKAMVSACRKHFLFD